MLSEAAKQQAAAEAAAAEAAKKQKNQDALQNLETQDQDANAKTPPKKSVTPKAPKVKRKSNVRRAILSPLPFSLNNVKKDADNAASKINTDESLLPGKNFG